MWEQADTPHDWCQQTVARCHHHKTRQHMILQTWPWLSLQLFWSTPTPSQPAQSIGVCDKGVELKDKVISIEMVDMTSNMSIIKSLHTHGNPIHTSAPGWTSANVRSKGVKNVCPKHHIHQHRKAHRWDGTPHGIWLWHAPMPSERDAPPIYHPNTMCIPMPSNCNTHRPHPLSAHNVQSMLSAHDIQSMLSARDAQPPLSNCDIQPLLSKHDERGAWWPSTRGTTGSWCRGIVPPPLQSTHACCNQLTHRTQTLSTYRWGFIFHFVYFSLILKCSRGCEADFHVLERVW
jgi:hypothetical protein